MSLFSRISIVTSLLAMSAVAAEAQSAPVTLPFRIGERLQYDVKFGSLKVGTGSMEVMGHESVRGIDALRTVFRVKGGTFFYKVNDVFESWIDTRTMSSLRFISDLEEGGRDRHKEFEIYPDRAVYVEKGKSEQPSVREPLDDGSFLYFIRTVPLRVGETYEFNRYFRPDRNPVRIRVVRRERITVPAGTFDAVVLHPVIKTKGIFSENGRAEVWIADDSTRMMLQMKSKLSFGSLNLYLRRYRPTLDSSAAGGGTR